MKAIGINGKAPGRNGIPPYICRQALQGTASQGAETNHFTCMILPIRVRELLRYTIDGEITAGTRGTGRSGPYSEKIEEVDILTQTAHRYRYWGDAIVHGTAALPLYTTHTDPRDLVFRKAPHRIHLYPRRNGRVGRGAWF